uniref:PPFIA binding protein 1a n=1 Tax=Cyprinus carpio TaxID=7962 RepID=A0A8C2IBI3_CYPCA
MEWLQSRLTNGHGSAAGDLVNQERLTRLESDKECLVLQVSVLTDQVEVQGEKIRDLDSSLEEHRMKLNATEELLQQELLSRSALETEKLELLTEVSSLKLKLAAAEGDCRESEVRKFFRFIFSMHFNVCTCNVVNVTVSELDSPFSRWSKEQVCEWLQNQGLDLYVDQAQQWISSGQTLLKASQHDLEKDMGIRHPLHRKKLQLALQSLGSEEEDAMGKLDYNWVTRWLDDIGLPQYKSQFDEGRVDGRMLHYMTVDDLLGLKVGSVLHHLSIKRAIQVLRINCYDPSCLRRRPTENNPTPAEICQWTNHRVMEWLRSVDLAEYAPNLRGSGVHGGLMVLEPRFNVETMALLLNIPPNKTLLRRHLATNFHLLIGSEAQRLKQEYLENPDYTVLTATAKVKPRRLSFGSFGTLRRKRQEEMEEYVCPMDVQMPQSSSFNKGLCVYEDSLDQLEQFSGNSWL